MPFLACSTTLAIAATAGAQPSTDLARYFGFDAPRIITVGDNAGPAFQADVDGDGLTDLIVANNRKSRIEIFTQRRSMRSDEEMERDYKVNKLPPNPWFDRSEISVAHFISAFRPYDFDNDGDVDIIYAGRPEEVVILEQTARLTFDVNAKRRVRGLSAGQDGFEVADVQGGPQPELLVLVEGRINIYNFSDRGVTGEPTRLGSGGELVAFFVEDYNGDGAQDILGVIPDDGAPLRMWTQSGPTSGRKDGRLGAEIRLDMPEVREVEPVRFPDRAAASIHVIERASRRIVMYDVVEEDVNVTDFSNFGGEVDALAEVQAFRTDDKDRTIAIGDVTGDGRIDMIGTDPSANSLVLFTQSASGGLTGGESSGTFKERTSGAIGDWDGSGPDEVFVLSTKESTVGVSTWNSRTGRLDFPTPLPLATAGAEPVAMNHVMLGNTPAVAVVVREKRDHTLEIHMPNTEPAAIELEDVNRPPNAIVGGDFDRDGKDDLILFTPNEPMVMVRSAASDATVLTDDDMPQFGLVSAAGPDNTALFDIDNDGSDELLIADENFVRACTYSAAGGWRVVEQITMPDAASRLTGLTTVSLNGRDIIVASDSANSSLVIMARDDRSNWNIAKRMRLSGFDLGAIHAGAFHGDANNPDILCLSRDAFAFVRLAGRHVALEEFAAYRSDEDDRLEHETEMGDVNGDGFVDLIVLDAREQMCQVFTFSSARRLFPATEFEVFQSRLFRGGDTREFEPSAAIIADFTGDGADDLCLAVHDRYIIFPQTARPN